MIGDVSIDRDAVTYHRATVANAPIEDAHRSNKRRTGCPHMTGDQDQGVDQDQGPGPGTREPGAVPGGPGGAPSGPLFQEVGSGGKGWKGLVQYVLSPVSRGRRGEGPARANAGPGTGERPQDRERARTVSPTERCSVIPAPPRGTHTHSPLQTNESQCGIFR